MMSLLLLEVYVEFRETLRLIVFTLLSWRWAINHDNESLFSRHVHGKTKNVLPSPEVYCDMRNKFAFEFFSSQGGWIQKEEKEREQQVLRKFIFVALDSMKRIRMPPNNRIKLTPRKLKIFFPAWSRIELRLRKGIDLILSSFSRGVCLGFMTFLMLFSLGSCFGIRNTISGTKQRTKPSTRPG